MISLIEKTEALNWQRRFQEINLYIPSLFKSILYFLEPNEIPIATLITGEEPSNVLEVRLLEEIKHPFIWRTILGNFYEEIFTSEYKSDSEFIPGCLFVTSSRFIILSEHKIIEVPLAPLTFHKASTMGQSVVHRHVKGDLYFSKFGIQGKSQYIYGQSGAELGTEIIFLVIFQYDVYHGWGVFSKASPESKYRIHTVWDDFAERITKN